MDSSSKYPYNTLNSIFAIEETILAPLTVFEGRTPIGAADQR
jgi:hypothetical protein